MTEWKNSQCNGTEIPAEFETGISKKYVFQRRNFKRIYFENSDGSKTEGWEYEERKLTNEEYRTEFSRIQQEKIDQNRADIDYIMAMTDIE